MKKVFPVHILLLCFLRSPTLSPNFKTELFSREDCGQDVIFGEDFSQKRFTNFYSDFFQLPAISSTYRSYWTMILESWRRGVGGGGGGAASSLADSVSNGVLSDLTTSVNDLSNADIEAIQSSYKEDEMSNYHHPNHHNNNQNQQQQQHTFNFSPLYSTTNTVELPSTSYKTEDTYEFCHHYKENHFISSKESNDEYLPPYCSQDLTKTQFSVDLIEPSLKENVFNFDSDGFYLSTNETSNEPPRPSSCHTDISLYPDQLMPNETEFNFTDSFFGEVNLLEQNQTLCEISALSVASNVNQSSSNAVPEPFSQTVAYQSASDYPVYDTVEVLQTSSADHYPTFDQHLMSYRDGGQIIDDIGDYDVGTTNVDHPEFLLSSTAFDDNCDKDQFTTSTGGECVEEGDPSLELPSFQSNSNVFYNLSPNSNHTYLKMPSQQFPHNNNQSSNNGACSSSSLCNDSSDEEQTPVSDNQFQSHLVLFRPQITRSQLAHQREERTLSQIGVRVSSDHIINCSLEDFHRITATITNSHHLETIKSIRKRGRNRLAARRVRSKPSAEIEKAKEELNSLKERRRQLSLRRDLLKQQLYQERRRHGDLMSNFKGL